MQTIDLPATLLEYLGLPPPPNMKGLPLKETIAGDARVYDDRRMMLEEGGFDLFVNALPSPLHFDARIDALNRGLHVVCEKPIARRFADFDRIAEAAEKNGRLLCPFQNNRLQPYFDKIQ